MTDQSVELVRRYFGFIDRMLADYWTNPVPLSEYPGIDEAFADVHPDAEWTPPFLENPIRGREAWLANIWDFFDAAEYWRIEVEEVSDLGRDTVLVRSRNSIRGKDSGLQVDQAIFTLVEVREGKIASIRDFTERRDADEAAGLRK